MPPAQHRPLLPASTPQNAAPSGDAPLGAGVQDTLRAMDPHLADDIDRACDTGFGAQR